MSVSDDGVTWTTFPCTATQPPWGACAGWHPVQPAATTACDPANGGDPYDLADVGVVQARFVRIVDKTQGQTCDPDTGPNTERLRPRCARRDSLEAALSKRPAQLAHAER